MMSMSLRVLAGAFSCIVLGGCAVIDHLPELQTMAEFSRDKNVQHADIARTDANYDALSAVLKAGKIKEYPDTTAILRNFGEPALRRPDPRGMDVWMYRHAIPQTAKDKIYLIFDNKGRLIDHQQEEIRW